MNRALTIFIVYGLLLFLSGFLTTAGAALGDLDTSYSFDGKLVDTLSGVSTDRGEATALQADGRILVAGTVAFGNNRYACGISRFNADGSLDTTFDGDGKVSTQIVGVTSGGFSSLALQADGRIVVAAAAVSGGQGDFALARYFIRRRRYRPDAPSRRRCRVRSKNSSGRANRRRR